ncbi:MAG TPA: PSD1 and planctomycete cytochrome C domain-containing protein [Gemmataceae bacterium]|nr:PSD1 and planctomycete cytochrome C domain-containing protein [Gemmataceae bacterium]
MRNRLLLASAFLACGIAPVRAQDVDFQRDIRPILSNQCFKCHGPALQKGGVRLDSHEAALKKKAIVPGKIDASHVIERILAEDAERMPPKDAGERLKPAQVELLKKWIAQGAKYTPHWAFVKPKAATLPSVKNAKWVRNPIDAFVLVRLEKEGLQPSPEADRATLVRRLSIDLTGLLPTPAEVDDFLNDKSADAYEKVVDRLLASPHYGERQARHWLDLARYADSNGYTIDGKRSIWMWRDWVIKAFNKDMPFDQFTIEQLAGDMLPNATRDQQIATGFHRNTSFNEEGGTSPEQFRVERTVDRTNTTGATWLGLTVGCAQCHTHKYDPISHREYYQLYAFFNSMEEPKLSMPTPVQEKKLKDLNDALAKAKKQATPKTVKSADVDKLLADLEKEINGGWRVIYPKTVMADQGTKLDVLDDRSVLASGKAGDFETYTVHGVAPETGTITAIRLEALTHASLPKTGPGRSGGGNFVLSGFVFETDGVPHKFRKAVADHSQGDYPVNDVVKNDVTKGWGISGGIGRDHHAILHLDKPHPVREGQAFVFTLRHNKKHAGYSLGRFRIAVTFASERFLALPLEAQKVVLIDPVRRTAKEMEQARQALLKAPPPSARVTQLQKEIKALEAQIDSTLILREAKSPRVTKIQKRGDFLDLGDEVQPDVFAILNPLTIKGRSASRLDFARWLVTPENPLTSRVVMNRIWQHYFGKGIVETENDFGIQGSLPTHPELLDWLAVEFSRDWATKRMHKLIVMSATYRQSSNLRPDLRTKDPLNKLLARQSRLRLDAEIIRDTALSASGLLTRKIGGPGVYPPQPPEIFAFTQNKHPWPESTGPDRYRRGMYTFIWRQSQHPLLTTFDAPDAQVACTRRNRSNTPLQALHLANDPVFVEIAKGLGERIQKEGPADDVGKLTYAFKLCYSRTPSKLEEERLLTYLHQQREAKAGPWTMVARVLLNLDEFVTRE